MRSHSKTNFKNISPLLAVSLLSSETVPVCIMWGTDFPVIIIANLRSTRFSRSNPPFSYKYKKTTILDWNFHVWCLLIIEQSTVSIEQMLNYDPSNNFQEPNKILHLFRNTKLLVLPYNQRRIQSASCLSNDGVTGNANLEIKFCNIIVNKILV